MWQVLAGIVKVLAHYCYIYSVLFAIVVETELRDLMGQSRIKKAMAKCLTATNEWINKAADKLLRKVTRWKTPNADA